jgi:hypothetical protein
MNKDDRSIRIPKYILTPKKAKKVEQAKEKSTGRSPRHTQATTAGHLEGTKQKYWVENRAANEAKEKVKCEIIKT